VASAEQQNGKSTLSFPLQTLKFDGTMINSLCEKSIKQVRGSSIYMSMKPAHLIQKENFLSSVEHSLDKSSSSWLLLVEGNRKLTHIINVQYFHPTSAEYTIS
jgi:hypothetical protein